MLALVGDMQQVSQEIKNKLWQGGKTNTNKFHLVYWATVGSPKKYGGLEIKDPTLMNLALGANLIWRMILGQPYWWKKIFIQTTLVEIVCSVLTTLLNLKKAHTFGNSLEL